jgi:hypothetical protein
MGISAISCEPDLAHSGADYGVPVVTVAAELLYGSRAMRDTRVGAILVETWYLADTACAIGRVIGAQVVVLTRSQRR